MQLQHRSCRKARLSVRCPFVSFILVAAAAGLPADAALSSNVSAQQKDDSLMMERPLPAPKRVRPKPTDPLQWNVRIPGKDDQTLPVKPQVHEFFAGEKFQILVKAGQGGYLYVMQHTQDKTGKTTSSTRLIFNYIVKRQEVLVPIDCEYRDKYGRCWWQAEPTDGQKVVTLILSKEPLSGLSAQIPTAGVRMDQRVMAEINRKLKAELELSLPESKRAYLYETIALTLRKERRAIN